MKISHYWDWMKGKIIDNGGMGACGKFKLTAEPSLGTYRYYLLDKQIWIFLFGSSGKSEIPDPPPGLVLIGGDSEAGPLSSVETLGFAEDCKIPHLPEKRYGAGSFESNGELAVCGGWWDGKPNSTDCLTLNKEEGRWERGHLRGVPDGAGGVKSVVSVESVGVYLVHGASMSFLAENSTDWVEMEVPIADVQCATLIDEFSFLIFGGRTLKSVREFVSIMKEADTRQGFNGTDDDGGKTEGWQVPRWPNLQQERRGPGCGATTDIVIVAGGVSGWQDILDTVEIFQLKTRALGTGGRMAQARAFFSLVPVGETFIRLLAVGGEGLNGVSLSTTEWWNHDDYEWEEGPVLDNPRSSLAASLVPVDLVCGSLTNGTFCQTEQNNFCLPTSECTLQGDGFVCQTEGSEEERCDEKKCALHPEIWARQTKAPKQESQNTGCAMYTAEI